MKTFGIVDIICNIVIAEFLASDEMRYGYNAYMKLDEQAPDYHDYIYTRKYCICKARGLNPRMFNVIEL